MIASVETAANPAVIDGVVVVRKTPPLKAAL
jgi:hypothetical protein